jgi:hypothetical protein
LFDEI